MSLGMCADLAGTQEPRGFVDPLFRKARDHVDDLFHSRVAVKCVAQPMRHTHAHEEQLVCGRQARARQPLVLAPGQLLHAHLRGRHEAQPPLEAHRALLHRSSGH